MVLSSTGRRVRTTIVLGVAGLGCVSCASSTPSHAHSPRPTAAPSSNSSPPSTATSFAPPATAVGCPPAAVLCDTFDNPSSGWRTDNKASYFEQYDPYSGGSYRIGLRVSSTAASQSPAKLGSISADFSVRVDVDAVVAQASKPGGGLGVDCWAHRAKDHVATAAFLFFVYSEHATIVLWNDLDGGASTLATKTVAGLLKTGAANHVQADCIQAPGSGGGAQARLNLTVNGTAVVSATYGKSVKNEPWSVSATTGESRAGVLASGTGADIFYDNFALTSLAP